MSRYPDATDVQLRIEKQHTNAFHWCCATVQDTTTLIIMLRLLLAPVLLLSLCGCVRTRTTNSYRQTQPPPHERRSRANSNGTLGILKRKSLQNKLCAFAKSSRRMPTSCGEVYRRSHPNLNISLVVDFSGAAGLETTSRFKDSNFGCFHSCSIVLGCFPAW